MLIKIEWIWKQEGETLVTIVFAAYVIHHVMYVAYKYARYSNSDKIWEVVTRKYHGHHTLRPDVLTQLREEYCEQSFMANIFLTTHTSAFLAPPNLWFLPLTKHVT